MTKNSINHISNYSYSKQLQKNNPKP